MKRLLVFLAMAVGALAQTPSITSVLTGVLPSEHGVEHATLEDASMRQEMISEELPSLAASLRAAGYRTVAVVGSGHLDASLGYARGFDDYTGLGFVEQDGVWAEVERRIPELEQGDAPYFLWVHLIDAHAPNKFLPVSIQDKRLEGRSNHVTMQLLSS